MEEKTKTTHHKKTYRLVLCALFAAILCIFAPITIPIGPIPITLATFAVMLAGVMLGPVTGAVSVAVYLLIGLCGLPVFAGGKSGFPALVGPTGGYLWSFVLMAFVIGLLCRIPAKNRLAETGIAALACVLGTAVCYFFGTIQFMAVAGYPLQKAMAVCVLPFIPFDLVKAVCASVLGVQVKAALRKTGLMPF